MALSRFDDTPRPDQPLVVLLADDTDDEDHDLLFPALHALGISVVRVHPHDLTVTFTHTGATFFGAGQTLKPDLVVGWGLGSLLLPSMAHLETFAAAGIPVINDALTLFRAQNKYVTSALLAARNVVHYPVVTGNHPSRLSEWMREVNGPVVMKPLFGFGGSGLRRVQGEDERARVLNDLENSQEPFYAMPWIENPGRDIRVYTVNHHPVFAMYRFAPPGQWITNVQAGGAIAMCPLTDDLISCASAASLAAGTLIGGVDIGEDEQTGELVVYEVNSCPTCEPPVLEAVADFLAAAADNFDSALRRWRPRKVYDQPDHDPALFHPSKHRLLRGSV